MVSNFYSNNYIEYESNGDRNKILSTIAIDFIFSKDTDEECVMHSNSDNILVIYDKTDDLIKEIFE